METLRIDETNYLTFRETPWDTRVLGLKSSEMTELHYADESAMRELLARFEQVNRDSKVEFSYARIPSGDRRLKAELQSLGFYFAETSMLLSVPLAKRDFGAIFKDGLPLATPLAEADFAQIKEIARDSFDHSRFHEDPNIGEAGARARYFNWIDDLRKQRCEFLLHKVGDRVACFLAYERRETLVNLTLAGSRRELGMLSPLFWASFLTEFQKRGLKRADAVVSASNIGILNIYEALGFKTKKTYFGFHKLY